MPYVEFHGCSAFSFRRGGSFPEHLDIRAAELQLPAVALLDRDGVYGMQRFSVAARENGVRPIVGCELTMEDGAILPLLVESRTGYKNLCELLTQAHLRSEKGKCSVQWEELPEFSEGLIALFSGTREPADRLHCLINAYGRNNVFVEIQRHLVRGENRHNEQLIDLARTFRLPLLATNGVQYATPPGRQVLDVFTCIREHTHLDAAGRRLTLNAERHLKSDQEMRELFHDLPEAIDETEALAERLTFSLENIGYQFPDFP